MPKWASQVVEATDGVAPIDTGVDLTTEMIPEDVSAGVLRHRLYAMFGWPTVV